MPFASWSARWVLMVLSLVTLRAVESPHGWDGPGFLPVTADRLSELPAAEQPAWRAYLQESERHRALDDATFAAELKQAGLTTATEPPELRSGELPLNRDAAYYASDEARQLADGVVSYQTPAGGWNKSLNFHIPRKPGQEYGHEAFYRGTFDNDSTAPQLQFLARVIGARGASAAPAWREAFERGLGYVLAAQYPNGGWPQVYPLGGGYHDNVTFNDNMFTNILSLLREVASGQGAYSFVSTDLRQKASAAFERGLACMLRTQIQVNGTATAWGQQYDAITLKPAAARNYEPPSISSAESAGVVLFLMTIEPRRPEVSAAIVSAHAWFEKTAIPDSVFKDPDGQGRRLVSQAGAGPAWSRLYEIGTDKPIFGDRDKTIHYAVEEISKERRNGYNWYGNAPASVLKRFPAWEKRSAQK